MAGSDQCFWGYPRHSETTSKCGHNSKYKLDPKRDKSCLTCLATSFQRERADNVESFCFSKTSRLCPPISNQIWLEELCLSAMNRLPTHGHPVLRNTPESVEPSVSSNLRCKIAVSDPESYPPPSKITVHEQEWVADNVDGICEARNYATKCQEWSRTKLSYSPTEINMNGQNGKSDLDIDNFHGIFGLSDGEGIPQLKESRILGKADTIPVEETRSSSVLDMLEQLLRLSGELRQYLGTESISEILDNICKSAKTRLDDSVDLSTLVTTHIINKFAHLDKLRDGIDSPVVSLLFESHTTILMDRIHPPALRCFRDTGFPGNFQHRLFLEIPDPSWTPYPYYTLDECLNSGVAKMIQCPCGRWGVTRTFLTTAPVTLVLKFNFGVDNVDSECPGNVGVRIKGNQKKINFVIRGAIFQNVNGHHILILKKCDELNECYEVRKSKIGSVSKRGYWPILAVFDRISHPT